MLESPSSEIPRVLTHPTNEKNMGLKSPSFKTQSVEEDTVTQLSAQELGWVILGRRMFSQDQTPRAKLVAEWQLQSRLQILR